MTESNNDTLQTWKRDEQWVSRVIQYSSQYNDNTWSANQIIGPPKVYPRYGDLNGAWAQGHRAADEYIIVEFERAVFPDQIDIYETYNPGAVVKVSARNGNDNDWITVWETPSPHTEAHSRIFTVPCSNISSREINQIRLDVNCTAAGSWCEIDCIKLVGYASHRGSSYKELATNLKQLLLNDYLADVFFQLDDEQIIPSYRNILSSRCIYFEQLFDEYSLDNNQPIRIKNISYEAFYQILHFIYTETIEPVLPYTICLELMRNAEEYYLSPIYNEAFMILKKLINKTNVVNIFVDSQSSSNDNQQDKIILNDAINLCVEFIQKNRRDVYQSEQIQSLTKDMLLQLIQLVL
ncbi:unnamed protein product [Adineta steineri]|uniref:BTB domain-containing protein n=1 Tax=Adineta steineri TaxID=433720 RepID=A0A813PH92_9BILA|nr:unnamed protein product [Adineta steineri]CAF3476094.1 unnamed protein product [Adineta steineri]